MVMGMNHHRIVRRASGDEVCHRWFQSNTNNHGYPCPLSQTMVNRRWKGVTNRRWWAICSSVALIRMLSFNWRKQKYNWVSTCVLWTVVPMHHYFFRKGKFYWFQDCYYIKVIHQLKSSRPLPRWHIALHKSGNKRDMLMAINPKTRLPPICSGKTLLGHLIQELWGRYNYILWSVLLENAQVWSQCEIEQITCKNDIYLFSNTIVFLHNHTAQQVAAAPRSTKYFKSCLIPCSQVPNILDTLRGLERPQDT
jgi:hypothetical protein